MHLHPLTLEDILQQEPREKLELFPKLGYYFIVFRAIRPWSDEHHASTSRIASSAGSIEGGVYEIVVYLVVFQEGICTV